MISRPSHVATLLALALAVPPVHAQCEGWKAGPLQLPSTGTNAVDAMTPYNGRLVMAGQFYQATTSASPALNVVAWDGSNLTSFDTGMDGIVGALKSYSTGIGINTTHELVAGGSFTHASGTAVGYVARWDESTVIYNEPVWRPMGSGFDSYVWTLERAIVAGSARTYAGGEFTHSGSTTVNRVARWNPGTSSWEALGTGMNGAVRALRAYGGDLYAGGDFTTAGGVATGGLARWDGTSWSAVGGYFLGSVLALEVFDNTLVIGGGFPGINASPNLAAWNGTAYTTLGTGGTDDLVRTLHAVGTRLYAGGEFLHAGGAPAYYVAYFDGAWHPMGGGTDDAVFAFADWGPELMVGGRFMYGADGSGPSPRLVRFTPDGLPWFLSQPYPQTAARGATATFHAGPEAGDPSAEQWYRNGVALVDGATGTGSTVSGSRSPSLVVAGVSGFDLGSYQAVLRDSCGADSSVAATLDFDGTAGVEPGGLVTSFDAVGPNPTRGESRLSFSLAHAARVAVNVLDLAGRRVGHSDLGTLGAGAHGAPWSARTPDGGPLGPGLYFVSLEVDGTSLPARRVTLVR